MFNASKVTVDMGGSSASGTAAPTVSIRAEVKGEERDR
jgi:hypothetical protein